MIKVLQAIFILLLFTGCSIKYHNINETPSSPKAKKLTKLLVSMDRSVDKDEASDMAVFSINYAKVLANRYNLTLSPNFQNFLINIGLRKKGYCYNYAFDMADALLKRGYQTMDIYHIVHKRGTIFEHNVLLITPKTTNQKGVVLDAWRDAGELYFNTLKNDMKNYDWKLYQKLN